ncbi:ABC transporter ATP-binding protein [Azorhizobium oxalatiphilum]|uniref:ABC transporter ATP-binding protein n=1 Tax=Azorhizobium oxalatiphilum TaxID=980631 RepID=A0A917CBZ1_9HYPH|nr:ABC transporter ATP-binding protein [Azorhizobium oxalatiphilum]GGF80943.1 ABC transporter ATP-binding protein [Azorhizobium oxalatiphilum]
MSERDHLVVRQASKRYGATTVLDRVDLSIRRGELVTLLGPSGCGKTTLLRLIAGLALPDTGSVSIAGRDVTRVPPHKRNVGVVFQNYALFPHLSVAGNVAFGLNVRRRPKAEVRAAVEKALALVHLGHLAERPISALSGGQQQRVALARALAVEPDVLLFDEALSALDRKLREEMQGEMRRMLRDIDATAIFVTHDQDEALTMSDRVAVMNGGRIEQLAEPRLIYERPASLFTLNFVGLSTRIPGTVVSEDNGTVEVDTPVGRLVATGGFIPGSRVIVATRPEHLRPATGDEGNAVNGRVRSIVFQGSRSLVEVGAGGETLLAELPGQEAAHLAPDAEIRLGWPVRETFAFPAPELSTPELAA